VSDKSSIEPLNHVLKDSDWSMRQNAAKALKKIKPYIEKAEQEEARRNTLSKAEGYEIALNFSKAAETYEGLEMWEDARRCREKASGVQSYTQKEIKEINEPASSLASEKKQYNISKKDAEDILLSSVELIVPDFLDADSTAEIIVRLANTSDRELSDISVDFSMLDKFFTREGDVDIEILLPSMELKRTIKIKPKFEEGIFPIKINISGSGVTIEKQYTIKVGGTEIY